MLHDAEQARGDKAQIVIQRATEKAAIEGRFTDDIIQEVKDEMKRVGYDDSEIELEVTTDLTYRGNYISGKLKVPNKYFFLFAESLLSLGEEEEIFHIRSASRLSEYVN